MSEGARSAGGRRPRPGATALVRGGRPSPASGPRRPSEAASRRPPPAPFTVAGLAPATVLTIFVAALFVPGELPIAGVGLSPATILMIVCILPLLLRLVTDPTNRLVALDVLMALHVAWLALAIFYNHGTERIVFVVNQTISLTGGYLVGRVLVRSAEDYRRLFTVFFWAMVFFLPFALIELLTRQRIVSMVLDPVMMVPKQAGQDPRLGLNRVQGWLEHSILFGLFCSLGIANLYQIHRKSFLGRMSRGGLALFMTFLSLSSAPFIAAGLQIAGLGWNGLTRWLPGRWWVLIALSCFVLLIIQLIYPGGVVALIIDNFAFDPATGDSRVTIMEYGSAEVARNPIFGIGFNDWVRPWWKKPSVDNFWLLTAMRSGMPALLLIWLALAVHGMQIASRRGLDETAAAYRIGYCIAGAGTAFILCTVHIWGATLVLVMLYIGAGAWIYTGDVGSGMPARRQLTRRRPVRP